MPRNRPRPNNLNAERRLLALQRAISTANTRTLAERNALLIAMKDEGYQFKDLAGLMSRAAMAVGDGAVTPDAAEKAYHRTRRTLVLAGAMPAEAVEAAS